METRKVSCDKVVLFILRYSNFLVHMFGMSSPGQTDSQVNDSIFRLAPPTCVDFSRTQIRTQVDARFSPFRGDQVIASQLYIREI